MNRTYKPIRFIVGSLNVLVFRCIFFFLFFCCFYYLSFSFYNRLLFKFSNQLNGIAENCIEQLMNSIIASSRLHCLLKRSDNQVNIQSLVDVFKLNAPMVDTEWCPFEDRIDVHFDTVLTTLSVALILFKITYAQRDEPVDWWWWNLITISVMQMNMNDQLFAPFNCYYQPNGTNENNAWLIEQIEFITCHLNQQHGNHFVFFIHMT